MIKRIIFFCVLTLIFTGTYAQKKNQSGAVNDTVAKPAKPKKNESGNNKRAELNLTPEQEEQFKAAAQRMRTTNQAIESDTTMSSQQKKQKRKLARETFINELNTFLTPEQIEKVKAFRKKED